MPANEPNDRQPEEHKRTRTGAARPSLVAPPDTAPPAAGDERPMRMLDALQGSGGASPGRAAAGAGGASRWPWVLGMLALAVGSAVAIGLMNTGAAPAAPDAATAPAVAMTAPPPAAPSSEAAGDAALVAGSVASSVAGPMTAPMADPLAGPAKVESAQNGLAALPGMEAAVAAQHPAATVPPAASAAAPALHAAAARPAKRPARAEARRTAPRHQAAPPAATTAATAAAPGDPDAELVAAIMARLETRGAAATTRAPERGSTIAALVSDCQALPDPASALACRRRICDGYWGKAQACPKSLAPSAKTRMTTAAARGEPVSR